MVFFELYGVVGFVVLECIIVELWVVDVLVLVDVKCGDIGVIMLVYVMVWVGDLLLVVDVVMVLFYLGFGLLWLLLEVVVVYG